MEGFLLDWTVTESDNGFYFCILFSQGLCCHLVVLVVDHLRDEGPGLGAPGLGAGLAGGGPVAGPAPGGLVAATQQL